MSETGATGTPAPAGGGGGGDGPETGGGTNMAAARDYLKYLARGDIGLALGVVAILVVLILPMPAWLLDVCLAISITFSVMVLMTVLFLEKPLAFSSFPTVLLIATMIRLALNLASTRLILAEGHTGPDAAGNVIEAFGYFVMGGNFVIGLIVFAILVLVNFVVITKGSGRIAEVAARFSLDSMPGKQMAIDADLSAGLINEAEAKQRRKDLEDETGFYGSMDGAAKFVRGDAIAGLLIVFINIIGGIIIGTAQMGLSMGEAAEAYTILTIGDGLVSQIPALVVSVAAGLLVSKGGVTGTTDKAVFGQMTAQPDALGLVSVLLILLSLLPGIPMLPFLVLAGITGGVAYYLKFHGPGSQKVADEQAAAEAAAAQAQAAQTEAPISQTLAIDNLRLELGYGLLPLVSGEDGSRLTDQIKGLRRQLASEIGFILPSVRIQDNLQLPANTYVVRVKEIEAGRGDIRPTQLLCMDPAGQQVALPGEATTEPAFGLPAMWIDANAREEAHFRGYTVVDPATVITTHLTEVVKDNLPELLSFAETQKLLDELSETNKKLVDDVIPNQITVGGLQRVLQALLAERVSIRDLATILEGVGEASHTSRNVARIAEHVRTRLARQLCHANGDANGVMPLVTLSPRWEQAFAESLIGDGDDRQLSMAPSQLQDFINAVREVFEAAARGGETPVLVTSAGVRPWVRSIIERFRPQTVVMSQNEIHPRARIRTLGTVQ